MARPRCGGRNRSGNPCGLGAGHGTDHGGYGNCKHHGGSTPNGRKHAVGEQAKAELARLNLVPVADPLSALASVTAEVLAWKDTMGGLVNKLTTVRYESTDEFGNSGGEQLRAEVALFERALDRCEKFLTAMARLDIDERLARITEVQVAVLIGVVVAAMDEAGVSGELRAALIAALRSGFRRQALES